MGGSCRYQGRIIHVALGIEREQDKYASKLPHPYHCRYYLQYLTPRVPIFILPQVRAPRRISKSTSKSPYEKLPLV
ncbi:uncharacterized protein UV8b_01127 [Ustilaginoidea virens]|uniref:Uncharacterized protein n=1 Tax=Ustilaginoidea virens TaxID=1159556 RepID=A0A8E5HK07_USTVR|nr:uncharacterized protein UV8b_01127 [Ustilaginoidea virens]QUC16886.1 hypothetical protein UV8b_01127 [Ustilaginoidea virens]